MRQNIVTICPFCARITRLIIKIYYLIDLEVVALVRDFLTDRRKHFAIFKGSKKGKLGTSSHAGIKGLFSLTIKSI